MTSGGEELWASEESQPTLLRISPTSPDLAIHLTPGECHARANMEPNAASDQYNSPMMAPSPSGPQRTKKKRVRNWTAEDRAVHREFEKSRREAFAERLTELTNLLPMLKGEQRPSKHVIVDASISYHKTQETRLRQAARAIQNILAERDDLLQEVNILRSLCQPGVCVPRQPRQPRPIDPAVVAMLANGEGPDQVDSITTVPSTVLEQARILPGVSNGVSPPTRTLEESGLPLLPQPACNTDDWSWPGSHKPQSMDLSQNIAENPSIFWNQSPGTITITPPEHLEASRLVDDSAFFWTHHPGVLATTPPKDGDLQDDSMPLDLPGNLAFSWSPSMPIPMPVTTPSSNEDSVRNNQDFQTANSFPNPASLSI
ncbi:hypothetical protein N7532_005126 [Penicillium argentinense]|uniref:BHLH domain-containing protein n=1 Tax=Penicillium argentinense TaxID=1131581 RepID=A0A9W9FDK2_9EURO|nr:uncharacterized protein N7532_005126 [Penicillium argentinense]KAJ5098125.1 hypothetical protein N7532_005126 [Penicillium argentinense]